MAIAPARAVTSPSLNTSNGHCHSSSTRAKMFCATSYLDGFFSLTPRMSDATPSFLPTNVPAEEPPIASTFPRSAFAAASSPAESFW